MATKRLHCRYVFVAIREREAVINNKKTEIQGKLQDASARYQRPVSFRERRDMLFCSRSASNLSRTEYSIGTGLVSAELFFLGRSPIVCANKEVIGITIGRYAKRILREWLSKY